MCVSPHRNAESPGQAKIRQLEVVALIDEEILRLEVSMKDAMGVAINQSRAKLVCEFLDAKGGFVQRPVQQSESGGTGALWAWNEGAFPRTST